MSRNIQSKRASAKDAPPQVYVPFLPVPTDEETEDTVVFFVFLFKAIIVLSIVMMAKSAFTFLAETIEFYNE
jgi:hypothetical protein